jgi:hypothetical protein
MKDEWLEEGGGTPLVHFRVYYVNNKYISKYLARVWYPVYLEPTEEAVRMDLIGCGWYERIEVVHEK